MEPPKTAVSQHRAGFRTPMPLGKVTVADMTDARQEGYDDGFLEGKAEGYKAGLASGQAEQQRQMDIELTKIRQLVQAMQQPYQGFRNDLVTEIKLITKSLCETFLHHTIAHDQGLLEHLVEQALAQLLPSDHQVVVHVNSHNSEVVEQALSTQLETDAWRIQVNEKLSDGNVYLESGHSRIAIDLDQLLHDYMQQLD